MYHRFAKPAYLKQKTANSRPFKEEDTKIYKIGQNSIVQHDNLYKISSFLNHKQDLQSPVHSPLHGLAGAKLSKSHRLKTTTCSFRLIQ